MTYDARSLCRDEQEQDVMEPKTLVSLREGALDEARALFDEFYDDARHMVPPCVSKRDEDSDPS